MITIIVPAKNIVENNDTKRAIILNFSFASKKEYKFVRNSMN